MLAAKLLVEVGEKRLGKDAYGMSYLHRLGAEVASGDVDTQCDFLEEERRVLQIYYPSKVADKDAEAMHQMTRAGPFCPPERTNGA